MAADFAALVVQLELQAAQFTQGMEQATQAIERTHQAAAQGVEGVQKLAEGFDKVVASAKRSAEAFGLFKLAEGVAKVAEIGDHMDTLRAQFDALAGSSEKGLELMTAVEEISTRTATPLDAVATSMRRLVAGVQGIQPAQATALVDLLTKLGSVTGAGVEGTAAAISRLVLMMQTGDVSARGLRSLLTDMPGLANTLAVALNKSTGELYTMARNGQITADVLANAVLGSAQRINQEFAKLPVNATQGWTALANASDSFLASLNRATGTSTTLGATLRYIADTIKEWSSDLDNGATQFSLLYSIARALALAVQTIQVGFAYAVLIVRQLTTALEASLVMAEKLATLDFSGVAKAYDAYDAKIKQANADFAKWRESFVNGNQAMGKSTDDLADKFGKIANTSRTGGGAGGADRELAALKARAEAITDSVNPAALYNKEMAELNTLLDKGLISSSDFVLARQKYTETLNAAGDAIRRSVDPTFAYQQELTKLNNAYMRGQIEVETWVKAQEKAQAELAKAQGQFDWAKEIEDTAKKSSQAIGDFFGAVVTGSQSVSQAFQRMVESIIADIARLLAKAAALEILKYFGLGGGAGLTGGGGASVFGAWAPASSSLAPVRAVTFDDGGAPAGGGIVTPNPFQVTVHNYAGAAVSTYQDADGGLAITIDRVRKALAVDVARGGNTFASAIERTYRLGRG